MLRPIPSTPIGRSHGLNKRRNGAEHQHPCLLASWLCDHLPPAPALYCDGLYLWPKQTFPPLAALVKYFVSAISPVIQSLARENKLEIPPLVLTPPSHAASNSVWDNWIWIHRVSWNRWLPLIALTGTESVSLTSSLRLIPAIILPALASPIKCGRPGRWKGFEPKWGLCSSVKKSGCSLLWKILIGPSCSLS